MRPKKNNTNKNKMLKLIPQENPEEIRRKVAKNAKRFIASGPGVNPQRKISPKVVIKILQSEDKKDRGILRSVCINLIHFVKGRKKFGEREVGDLIHSMQRSVLSLERVRNRMARGGRKAKRKGRGGRGELGKK
jgi:hypothetical protein